MLKKCSSRQSCIFPKFTSFKIGTLEQFFLTVGQNNFVNKIPFSYFQIRKNYAYSIWKLLQYIAKRNKKEKLRDKFYPKFNLNAAILKTNKNEKLRDKFTF